MVAAWTHLFYRQVFEKKYKNLAPDFYFFDQVLPNLVVHGKKRDLSFLAHMRRSIFISYENFLYLVYCKIEYLRTLNHMARAYSTLGVLVISFNNFCSPYFWETKIFPTIQ